MTLKPPSSAARQVLAMPASHHDGVRQTVYELLNSFSHSAIRRSFGWRHLTSITLPNALQTAHHHALRVRTAMASLHHRVATSVRGATDGTGT